MREIGEKRESSNEEENAQPSTVALVATATVDDVGEALPMAAVAIVWHSSGGSSEEPVDFLACMVLMSE